MLPVSGGMAFRYGRARDAARTIDSAWPDTFGMARKRPDPTSASVHKSLTPPGVFLIRMLVFLTLVAFLAAILHEQLLVSLMTNPGLNGLIIGVLCLGIIYAFRQVIRLYPEIRFVNAFRISDPGLVGAHQPVLLAPMATMLRDRTGALSLSTVSMRTIMDSIGSRHGTLHGGSAGVPGPARHLLGLARNHSIGGSRHQHAQHVRRDGRGVRRA
jgi:hypothetical protein